MRKFLLNTAVFFTFSGAPLTGAALAGEKECYEYDAHGRLVKVIRIDDTGDCAAPTNETTTEYTYDDADNRTEKKITPP